MQNMQEKFINIQMKIKEAKEEGNKKKLKLYRNKLNKWQEGYGAYKPLNYSGPISEL